MCLRLSVAAFTRKRKDARFDLWPALDVLAISNSISLTHVASNVTIGVGNRRVSRGGVWHWLLAPCNLVRISAILSLKYAENVLAHSLSES